MGSIRNCIGLIFLIMTSFGHAMKPVEGVLPLTPRGRHVDVRVLITTAADQAKRIQEQDKIIVSLNEKVLALETHVAELNKKLGMLPQPPEVVQSSDLQPLGDYRCYYDQFGKFIGFGK